MAPPNIRDVVGDIREALDRFPPDALKEILTYVFKEYVVEGPAPISSAPPTLRDEFAGMGFAEVIRALQLRLDLPELALFEVQGDRVSVKIGGRPVPLEAAGARQDPVPAAMAVPAAAPSLPPAGDRVPQGIAQPVVSARPMPATPPAAAPRPAPAPAHAPAPVAPAPAAPAVAVKAIPEEKPGTSDRFRKLEID